MKIPQSPPLFEHLFRKTMSDRSTDLIRLAGDLPHGGQRYFHWNELRFRPSPKGFTHEEWWLAEKMTRLTARRTVSLKDKRGKPFSFIVPSLVTELLHQIDRNGGTLLQVPEPVTNPDERDRYVIRSLMEEAITSSQLEGAAVTREVAKKMLAEGRSPRNRGEQMIVNNFVTMRRIIDWKAEPLTPELVLQIHRHIAENALDKPEAVGRLRRADETVEVADDMTDTVFHIPPASPRMPLEASTRRTARFHPLFQIDRRDEDMRFADLPLIEQAEAAKAE